MIARYQEHSANERTFLAWVRTVVSVIGFGLVVARMGEQQTPAWSEGLLLFVGAFVMLVAYLRMRRVNKRISKGETFDDDAVPTDTLLLLLTASLFGLLGVFALHVW